MSNQHTPGPWHVDPGARSTVIKDGSGYYVAEMDVGAMDNGWEIGLADANLIAAAPDLLEALVDLLENPAFQVAVGGNPNAVHDMLARGRAALVKARGDA